MTYHHQLHTHTYRCQHATGDVPDYARVAAAGGCAVLGISDHAPLPDGRWEGVRMAMPELDDYEAAILRAKREQPGLRIRTGLEVEWLPQFESYLREEILGARGYDYLIGAGHYTEFEEGWRSSFENLTTPGSLVRYATMMHDAMASGLFAFIAHPDLIGCCNDRWTPEIAACARDLCQASVATGIPLELNGYGLRKPWRDTPEGRRPQYPWIPFWEIAGAAGVRVVLNSDAHRPEDTLAGHAELCAIRDRFGLVEADLGALVVA
jgi:histidinol-phosphatase (PHP family)